MIAPPIAMPIAVPIAISALPVAQLSVGLLIAVPITGGAIGV